MTQTEHYQLNQWSASDRVHHDDFNADNLAIDAALAGKLGKTEILKRTDAPGWSFQAYSLSFPQIDWNEWDHVCLLANFPPYEENEDRASTTVTYRVIADGKRLDLTSIGLPGMLVVFLPFRNGAELVSGFVLSDRLTPFSGNFSYNSIKSMMFSSESNMYLMAPDLLIFGRK